MKRTPKTASVVLAKHLDVKPLHYGWTTEKKNEIIVIATDNSNGLVALFAKWNGDILTIISKSIYTISEPIKCKEHIEAIDYITDDEENEGE